MPKGYPADLVGQRFGRWLVTGKTDDRSNNQVKWVTRCDCGSKGHVATVNLIAGRSTQCRKCGNSKAHSRRWNTEQ